jgi:hypothetical protein
MRISRRSFRMGLCRVYGFEPRTGCARNRHRPLKLNQRKRSGAGARDPRPACHMVPGCAFRNDSANCGEWDRAPQTATASRRSEAQSSCLSGGLSGGSDGVCQPPGCKRGTCFRTEAAGFPPSCRVKRLAVFKWLPRRCHGLYRRTEHSRRLRPCSPGVKTNQCF